MLCLQFCHRQPFVLNLHCLRRCVASEQFKQRGGKGVHIALWREGLHAILAVLLGWGVATTDAHRRGGSALRGGKVVLLRHAEVNQHNLTVIVALHQVARLDVEVVDFLAMDIHQRLGSRLHIADSLCKRNGATACHHIAQRLALNVFHHIIGGVVFLKHVENAHNVGVIKPKDGFGLLNKLLLEALHRIAVV